MYLRAPPLTLALSPSPSSRRIGTGTGRGDKTPSPALAGEGWGGVASGHEGRLRFPSTHGSRNKKKIGK